MVSTLNLEEKYNRVRRNFCFYLDIQDHGLARSISRKIQDMGLQQEVFLTSRVTHVVAGRARGPAACARRAERPERRADAMLQRVRAQCHDAPPARPASPAYVTLTVQKAISLLDKLYDTFFTAPRKAHVRFFTKHFIKIEFLDKVCRPVFKEFDEWPEISLEPDLPRDKKEKRESPENRGDNIAQTPQNAASQKMTRKSRPRIKEKEEKEQKAGYCEMCRAEYADAARHRREPAHLAFVRDHTNFLALDSLISSGADVTSFLDKTSGVNGERRSLRKLVNGDAEPRPKRARPERSPDRSPEPARSPRRNGGLDDERRHSARTARRGDAHPEDRQYYKVVGVSTKLRSSGGFAAKRRESPPACNGTKPLVVKFRKVRRSELSVLSDEAEQFMFPKRASSTSSTSSDDDDDEKSIASKRRSPPKPQPTPPAVERRRLARPAFAMKEESSEEDSWPEDRRRRKRRAPAVARRGRRAGPARAGAAAERDEPVEETLPLTETVVPAEPAPAPEPEVGPLREEPAERCMKWEDGRLKYTPAVEQLEFAFESVPRSEPWYETFSRQDQDRVAVKNVPKYFALYSKAPKLPYEIGQLPPLKPNCCPLSDLVKREEKPGPSRAYGTRGMKKQRIRKRTAAVQALEAHPRKSPREHASTLAILGSAGLLHRRKHADDTKSTASEDTVSDAHSAVKAEPVASEAQEASERLRRFLSEVFEEAAEFDMSDETIEGDAPLVASTNAPDVSSLVSECEDCDIIRNEIREGVAARARGRRGRLRRRNRTGWPSRRPAGRASPAGLAGPASPAAGPERAPSGSGDGGDSSADAPDDDTAPSTASDDATNDDDLSEAERPPPAAAEDAPADATDDDEPLRLDLKVVVRDDEPPTPEKDEKRSSRSSLDSEDRELRKKRRALQGLLLQPVVRVARVDPGVARRLRSGAGRGRREGREGREGLEGREGRGRARAPRPR